MITGELGVEFALKRIKSDEFQKGDFDIASKLKHGFIMQTFGMEKIGPYVFIVSEYVENGSLADYIKQQIKNHQTVDVEIVTGLITQILTAVDFLHRGNVKTIIHRDLKPANILMLGVPRSGVEGAGVTIKLCDFGCARSLSFGKLAKTSIGTPLYSAPEFFLSSPDKLKYDEKVDNWAIGIILYELITLRYPFAIGSELQLIQEIATASIARPPEMDGGEWDILWKVLSGLTRRDPIDRLSCGDALKIIRGEVKAQELETEKHNLEWTVAEEKAEKERLAKELDEMKRKVAELEKEKEKDKPTPLPATAAAASAGSGKIPKAPSPTDGPKKPPKKKKAFILRDTNMSNPENVALWSALVERFGTAVDMYQADDDDTALKLLDTIPAKHAVYVASNRAKGGREFLIACRARGVPNDALMWCGNKAGWDELDWVRIRTAPDALFKYLQNYVLLGE